jgi:hypothetical protein
MGGTWAGGGVMSRAQKWLCAAEWLWFLAWGVASSVWCVTAAGQLSATYDEPFYLQAGLMGWRTGCHQYLFGAGTMPLPPDVASLPLYLRERWRGSPLDLHGDFESYLRWSRATTLVFWWVLLFHGWRGGRRLAGPWGGALAVALLATEPSLLAHASLATTDVPLAACLLALVYHFRTGRDGGWLRRVGLPAFWFAAAVLSKASGLVFGPVCLVAVELERLAGAGCFGRPGPWWRRVASPLLPAGRDLAAVALCGVLLALVCCSDGRGPWKSLAAGRDGLPAGCTGEVLACLGERAISMEKAYKAVLFQVHHNALGHDSATYLLGRAFDRPVWYYFPLALCIKLTLPLLALPLVLAVLRPRALANWACAAALALLALSPTFRVQIGVRFVLPLVALAVVGLAAAVVRAWRGSGPGWGRRAAATAALGSLLWAAASAAAAWPDGLRYANELWGGTEAGYRQLSDSNYDWGQGLKELARWQRQHAVPELDVWYFGTDPSVESLPVRALRPSALDGPIPAPGRYLAVSLTWLYGGYNESLAAAHLLSPYRPVARTRTFFIYDFTREADALPATP